MRGENTSQASPLAAQLEAVRRIVRCLNLLPIRSKLARLRTSPKGIENYEYEEKTRGGLPSHDHFGSRSRSIWHPISVHARLGVSIILAERRCLRWPNRWQ